MSETNTNASIETEAKAEPQTAEPPKQTQVDQNAEKLSTYETALRKIFKVADGEELGDIDRSLQNLKQNMKSLFQQRRISLLQQVLMPLMATTQNYLQGLSTEAKLLLMKTAILQDLKKQ